MILTIYHCKYAYIVVRFLQMIGLGGFFYLFANFIKNI
jgi:hypothetical protein